MYILEAGAGTFVRVGISVCRDSVSLVPIDRIAAIAYYYEIIQTIAVHVRYVYMLRCRTQRKEGLCIHIKQRMFQFVATGDIVYVVFP